MWRGARGAGRLGVAVLFSRSDPDRVEAPPEPGSPGERLRRMYTPHDIDGVSPELNTVFQIALTGTFTGAMIGGFVRSRTAYVNFIESNEATIFKTTLEAQKKLQNCVTIAFSKGAVEWGWRLGAFVGIFSLVSTTISVYRGETSVLEYAVAGTITGALYKANLGLAATLVGAGLGAALSTIGGVLIVLILKLSGVTMEDIRREFKKITETRKYHYKELEEKAATEKNDDLTRHHDLVLQEKGQKIIDDI